MSDLVPVKAGLPAVSRPPASRILVPSTIADAGEAAARRFLEPFAATIRNRNTRMAAPGPSGTSSPEASTTSSGN